MQFVVITHGAFYNYMLTAILNLPQSSLERYRFVMNSVALTRIDFSGDRVIVAYMNRVDFLPSELIT